MSSWALGMRVEADHHDFRLLLVGTAEIGLNVDKLKKKEVLEFGAD